jgi:hypothetical protein
MVSLKMAVKVAFGRVASTTTVKGAGKFACTAAFFGLFLLIICVNSTYVTSKTACFIIRNRAEVTL